MYISQTTQYALRGLSCMATKEGNAAIRTRDLSNETGIPVFYLSKIMRRLVTAGLLTSQKGHGGGFKFAQPLSEIYFADILKAMDNQAENETCVFGLGTCSSINPCILHDFWSDLKESFIIWSEKYTLQDIVHNVDLLKEKGI